jgi:hypothetical protein
LGFTIAGPNVIRENFDGEVVIVHLETGHYYGLEGTAGLVWQWVEQGACRAWITGEMQRTYPAAAEAAGETGSFLDALLEEGLIGEGGPDETPAAGIAAPASYQAPKINKFSDMQELLLLDPIHDTDESGWPLTARG